MYNNEAVWVGVWVCGCVCITMRLCEWVGVWGCVGMYETGCTYMYMDMMTTMLLTLS